MKIDSKSDLYRRIPSVDELIREARLSELIVREGPVVVTAAARTVLNRFREEIADGQFDEESIAHAISELAANVVGEVGQASKYSLRTVINATGVILHTNLGRSPVSPSALNHILNTAGVYSNLEFDIESGERGKRDVHVDRLFRKLLNARVGTAAPGYPPEQSSPEISTIVVNNNAAAVLLSLNSLADGAEVIVSRGELVEIGGSFRIPDVMAKSHAILREVGTTNRTSLADYESAINDKTKLLLRVHRSNFEITGFTQRPRLEELVTLARRRNIPLMEDLGSGSLFDLHSIGLRDEPGVLDSLHAGVDVVTYSGDKLLGGPQAGILSGSRQLISKMRANSLFRALRVDKLTYAALEATLQAYVKQDYDAIPALRMMRLSKDEIQVRAEKLAGKIRSPKIAVDLMDGDSVIGGGAAPSAVLPTCLLAVASSDFSADDLAARLRKSDPPIISRVQEDRVLLDLRTVFPEQDEFVAVALAKIGDM
ncbi:MAG: L-seryl-tRNA(Sec) selenium transferase [Terriglobales bacterium]